MNDLNPVRWQWYSRRGTTCVENRDACGIFQSAAYTFAVVVDASPGGERGIQFNACWITTVLDRMSPELPSTTSILSALHDGQRRLRTEQLFAEKASYVAIVLPSEGQGAHVFWCGDCGLGIESQDGNVEWLTRNHTLGNALEDLGQDLRLEADASKRHIVTRTLNARRFERPDVEPIPAHVRGSWLLATDGYRYRATNHAGHPDDDCSVLRIGGDFDAEPAPAHRNLFVRTWRP